MFAWPFASSMSKKNSAANPNLMNHCRKEPSALELTVRLNLNPPKPELFTEALTHSSYAHEHHLPSNERLEFLGDSILSLITCDFLYHEFPEAPEGDLAHLKSMVVSAVALAALAKQLGLEQHIRLGHGEARANGSTKPNILADLFEAFIGAYFLNFGFERTREYLVPLVKDGLAQIQLQAEEMNAKTDLQELTQLRGYKPSYRTVLEEGPPHARFFTVEVMANEEILGAGRGRSLKEAQNRAAYEGIKKLKSLSK